MNFEVETTPHFEKSLKRLIKKYPSLKSEFKVLVEKLEKEPETGMSIGRNCFKIRISTSSKGKGKSGGGRVITFVQFIHSKVTLVEIFDKSEMESISDADLHKLIFSIT
jgi:mRNA-degrading endonuclease RelE of RelBE toxin-antitoxin system